MRLHGMRSYCFAALTVSLLCKWLSRRYNLGKKFSGLADFYDGQSYLNYDQFLGEKILVFLKPSLISSMHTKYERITPKTRKVMMF